MTVLGLDTSCYTTSAALASDDGSWLSSRQLLPVEKGQRGLRQSEAVFVHVRQLPLMVEKLRESSSQPIDAVCASVSPADGEDSYMPVFLVGAGFGRALASALQVPFFETTHQRGHLRAARVDTALAGESFLALNLSGGTTDVLVKDGERLEKAACSLDLHAGQLVDRVGVKLGLPFPSGPHLERLAEGFEARGAVPVSMAVGGCHLSGAEAMLSRMIREGGTQPGRWPLYRSARRAVICPERRRS